MGKVAERAGINRDKARYWLGLLGESPVKSDGKLMVNEESATMLEAMRKTIAAGTSPAVAAQEVKGILSQPACPTIREPDTTARLESLEKSIMLLVESHERGATAIRAEISHMVEENRHLAGQIEGFQNQITALLMPPAPTRFEVWQPDPRPDPADSMPWYQRLWMEFVTPEKLRRFDS